MDYGNKKLKQKARTSKSVSLQNVEVSLGKKKKNLKLKPLSPTRHNHHGDKQSCKTYNREHWTAIPNKAQHSSLPPLHCHHKQTTTLQYATTTQRSQTKHYITICHHITTQRSQTKHKITICHHDTTITNKTLHYNMPSHHDLSLIHI